jgi:hypothetical protein
MPLQIFTKREGDVSNADLVIGTKEYNRIRYPHRGNTTPTWRHNIRFDLAAKREGRWRFRGPAGHPAKNRFVQDIADCINAHIHFKTKAFEYRPKDGSMLIYDQYVGKYDSEKGRLSSFTLRNINDRFSRYRLRDFGLDLISAKGKTYWRIRIGEGYLKYLMAIYGSLEKLYFEYRVLFKSIKYEFIGGRTDQSLIPQAYLLCELRDDIEYHTYLTIGICGPYYADSPWTHTSGIFHKSVKPDFEEYVCPVAGTSRERFMTCIKLLEPISDDMEYFAFNLKSLFKKAFDDSGFVLELIKASAVRRIKGTDTRVFTLKEAGTAVTIIPLEHKVTVTFVGPDLDRKTFAYGMSELDISNFFDYKGIRVTPTSTEDLISLMEESTQNVIFNHKSEHRFSFDGASFNVRQMLAPALLGKELLLAF